MKKLFRKPSGALCSEKPAESALPAQDREQDALAEEVAAIALAVKMYQEEAHINESTVITINRVSRIYSPWNSKIHGIPPMPDRK